MGQTCTASVTRGELVVPPGTCNGTEPPNCLPSAPRAADSSWYTGSWSSSSASLPLSTDYFVLTHKGGSSKTCSDGLSRNKTEGWKRFYAPRNELGRGVSATVFSAEAKPAVQGWNLLGGGMLGGASCWAGPAFPSLGDHAICGTGSSVSCLRDTRRKVALKRFKRLRSRSFQTEKAALQRIGVHPHVVRLLESYEDFHGEDMLVLEYCDGRTVFEAQADSRRAGNLLPELFAARLIRQVLLAIEHVLACGVEHQDVKPENMLLYDVCIAEQRAELKLGDFGWAAPSSGNSGPLNMGFCPVEDDMPHTGAGSLWYAPPELNPQPEQTDHGCAGAALPVRTPRSCGRTDMWSVGVVAYVLLVGQNPFSAALDQKDRKGVEAEVVRLVAAGRYDKANTSWQALPDDARDFIIKLMQVPASSRLCAGDALRHPFLTRRCARCPEAVRSEPPWRWPGDSSWARLDSFQHLCWLAVARAVAEPEVSREVVLAAFQASRTCNAGPTSYLWHLARELSSVPSPSWLTPRGAWQEILRLAFSYLDVDRDGVLSAHDISTHVQSKGRVDAFEAAQGWLAKWSPGPDDSEDFNNMTCNGFTPDCFRKVLRSAAPDASSDCEMPDNVELLTEVKDIKPWKV